MTQHQFDEIPDEDIEALMTQLTEDPAKLVNLLLTLQTNRAEQQYADATQYDMRSSPPVFERTYDEDGFVSGCQVSQAYREDLQAQHFFERIDPAMTADRALALLDHVDEQGYWPAIVRMLGFN